MKKLKTIGRILLIVFFMGCFMFGTMLYEGYKRTNEIKKSNSDITIWQRERDEIYLMEQLGFKGFVTHLSPGLHRHSIDTVTVKLNSWISLDSSFTGENYLKKLDDSTLFLFIEYSEALWKPKQIDIGDKITKEQFSFDFSIYKQQQFKKNLSLLFCSYTNPDTVIKKGNFVFGTYGTYYYEQDTLYSGTLINGKREGQWRYYQAYGNGSRIFEGQYLNSKRNGLFKKYYERTDQPTYKENYRDNLPQGQFTWWFSNGQVESKKYFDKGNPIGVWEFYNDDGKLIKKVNYDQEKSSR